MEQITNGVPYGNPGGIPFTLVRWALITRGGIPSLLRAATHAPQRGHLTTGTFYKKPGHIALSAIYSLTSFLLSCLL